LLFDEATSALDAATERRLLDNLRQDTTVRTCILVTHRQTGMGYCNRTYEIVSGRVTEVTNGT
jgi:ABC-type bacteriocin/lantibiotic exporter with double-glycine peptidase domain